MPIRRQNSACERRCQTFGRRESVQQVGATTRKAPLLASTARPELLEEPRTKPPSMASYRSQWALRSLGGSPPLFPVMSHISLVATGSSWVEPDFLPITGVVLGGISRLGSLWKG